MDDSKLSIEDFSILYTFNLLLGWYLEEMNAILLTKEIVNEVESFGMWFAQVMFIFYICFSLFIFFIDMIWIIFENKRRKRKNRNK